MLLLLMATMATSCIDEEFIGGGDASRMYLEVELLTPARSGSTRALTLSDEYLIKDISLLLFDENESLLAVPRSSQMTITTPGNVSRVKLALDKTAYQGKTVEVLFLANLTDNGIDLSSLDLSVGRSKEELLSDLKYAIDGIWPTTTTELRTFPMYGTLTSLLNKDNIQQTVNMLRAVARIQFFVNNGEGLTGGEDETKDIFKLSSVNVYYSRRGGYLAPLVDFTNDMTAVTLPSSVEDFGQRPVDSPLVYTVPPTESHAFRRSIYLPENNNISPSGTDEPVCMVVGGFFNDSLEPTYYRVDFIMSDTDEKYDILRNHTYDFNITAVKSPGKDTPEEALRESSSIDFEIKAWSEVDIADADMLMYELQVAKSVFVASYRGSGEECPVRTTYPTGEWQIDEGSQTAEWFTVSKNAAGDGFSITIDYNYSANVRSGSFTLSSGKLTKRIYVSQVPENTANCYTVSQPGVHALKATVMGNGEYGTEFETINDQGQVTGKANIAKLIADKSNVYNSDGSINKDAIKSARLIWQTRPGLITSVGGDTENGEPLLTEEGFLTYTVGERQGDELGGNALIGIYDESGNIIWSWHIWIVWDWIPENNLLHFLTTGVRSGFYFMDKNLGAMNNEISDAQAYGLLYEWGRKDPMRGAARFGSNDFYPTYGFTGEALDYDADNSSLWHSHGTEFTDILTSVRHPMDYSGTWGGGDGSDSPALWGNPTGATGTGSDPSKVFEEGKKSIYDPCPPGYKVPSINGFYFGQSGGNVPCIHEYNGKDSDPEDGYADIISNGYSIYYFGAYTGYEKYYTWMPMAPYYNGSPELVIIDNKEQYAFTWLNVGVSDGTAYPIAWHPKNNHIHGYGKYTTTKSDAGTVRCVKETDASRVAYTIPEKIVLQRTAGSNFEFEVATDLDWEIERNNLAYEWLKCEKTAGNRIKVTALTDNPSSADRIAYLVVTFSNGEKATVRIIQNGFSFVTGNITLAAQVGSTGSTEFTMPSGATASIVQDTYPKWFAPAISGNQLTARATATNLGAERTATVDVLIDCTPSYTYRIMVTQSATDIVFFNPDVIEFEGKANLTEELKMNKAIPSGLEWQVSSLPDFIEIAQQSGTTTGTEVKMDVTTTKANLTGKDRTGQIVFQFTAQNGETVEKTVTVVQKSIACFDKTAVELDKGSGKKVDIKLKREVPAGVKWEIILPDSPFFSVSPETGTTMGKEITIAITTTEANNTGSNRTDEFIVRLTLPDGEQVDHVITVTQKAK